MGYYQCVIELEHILSYYKWDIFVYIILLYIINLGTSYQFVLNVKWAFSFDQSPGGFRLSRYLLVGVSFAIYLSGSDKHIWRGKEPW